MRNSELWLRFFVPLFRIDHALFSDEYLIAQVGNWVPFFMRRGFDNFIPLVRGAWSNWGAALFAPYNIDKIPLDSACLMAKISIYLLWGPDYFYDNVAYFNI